MSDSIIQKIDNELANYYKQHSHNNDYFDKNQRGKFAVFCDANGFDDSGVAEELGIPVADCMLVDFDEDFPFPKGKQPKTQEERNEFIFTVITNCSKDKNAYTDNSSTTKFFDNFNFKISNQELEARKKVYTKQCDKEFIKPFLQDDTTFSFMAIGDINNIEYLQHLTDHYARSQVKSFTENKNLSLVQWAAQDEHIQQLTEFKGDEFAKKVTQAMLGFSGRIGSQLMLPPTLKFSDKLENVSCTVADAMRFVGNICSKFHSNCPCQFDLCLVLNPSQRYINDDDDDDEKTSGIDYVEIGNIEEILQGNNLQYIQADNKEYGVRLHAMYQELLSKLKQNSCRNKRFVLLIDHTKDEYQHYYMYEAPSKSQQIPNHAVSLVYFSNSFTCLLPGIGNSKTITTQTNCNMMTLSFHIKQQDLVKLYLFVNTQYMRFMPEDLMVILPLFFAGKSYAKSDEMKQTVEESKPYITDKYFDAFERGDLHPNEEKEVTVMLQTKDTSVENNMSLKKKRDTLKEVVKLSELEIDEMHKQIKHDYNADEKAIMEQLEIFQDVKRKITESVDKNVDA